MLPNKILAESEFIDLVSRKAQVNYFGGEIDFFETVAIHNLSNALRWFKTTKILIGQTIQIGPTNKFLIGNIGGKSGEKVRVLQLSDEYQNKQSLKDLCTMIVVFKKDLLKNKLSSKSSVLDDTLHTKSKL